MAEPTREQFEAAARKVMQSAPAGLSRDQFFALVDKELAGGGAGTTSPSASALMMESRQNISRKMTDAGYEEPSGLNKTLRGLLDMVTIRPRGEDTPAGHKPAFGDSLHDLSQMLPYIMPKLSNKLPENISGPGGIRSAIGRGMEEVGDIDLTKPLKSSIGKAGTTLKNAGARAKESRARQIQNTPNVSGNIDRGIEQEILPESSVDHYMPNRSGDIDSGLDMGTPPESSVDPLMPNRSGDIDTGMPSEEMPESSLERYLANSSSTPDEGIPQGEIPESLIDRYMPNTEGAKFGGGEPEVGAGEQLTGVSGATPSSDLESQLNDIEFDPGAMAGLAQDLRTLKGSRDAAREMFGSGSKSNVGAIKTMAPGPSRTPFEALERIEGANQPSNLDEMLRKLLEPDND